MFSTLIMFYLGNIKCRPIGNFQFARRTIMQLLTLNEISLVSGGDRGDASAGGAVAGGIAGGGAAAAIARAAGMGALRGIGLGAVGIVGGAIVFGGIAYITYRLAV
jgi:hypothetical protein